MAAAHGVGVNGKQPVRTGGNQPRECAVDINFLRCHAPASVYWRTLTPDGALKYSPTHFSTKLSLSVLGPNGTTVIALVAQHDVSLS